MHTNFNITFFEQTVLLCLKNFYIKLVAFKTKFRSCLFNSFFFILSFVFVNHISTSLKYSFYLRDSAQVVLSFLTKLFCCRCSRCFCHLVFHDSVDYKLLSKLDNVAYCPIQKQSRRSVIENKEEYNRHTVHHNLHLSCACSCCSRSAVLCNLTEQQLGNNVNYRQQTNLIANKWNIESECVNMVSRRQIGNPSGNKHSAAEFKVIVEQVVHCKKYDELEYHRQTSCHRVIAAFYVQLCCRFLQFLRIIFILILNFSHFWLQRLHLERAERTFLCQREHSKFKNCRKNND